MYRPSPGACSVVRSGPVIYVITRAVTRCTVRNFRGVRDCCDTRFPFLSSRGLVLTSHVRHCLSGRGCTDVRTKRAEARTPLRNQHRKKLAPPGIRTPARELSRPRAPTLASAMSKASVLTSAHGEARISTGHRPRAARTMHRQVGAVSEWLRRADLEPEGRGFESRRVFYSALVGQLIMSQHS